MIRYVAVCAAIMAIAGLVPTIVQSPYWLDVLSYAAVLAMYSVGVSIVFGQMGYVSFGHALFLGLGAYVAAILAADYGVNYWLAVACSIVPGLVAGFLIGLLAGRLAGTYFAIATLVVAGLFEFAAGNLVGLTNGPMGKMVLVDTPAYAQYLGWSDAQAYMGGLLAILGLVVVLTWCLIHSPVGRQWNAVRDNIALAESLGIPTLRVRIMGLTVSGAISTLAGALLVPKVLVVIPAVFGLKNSAIGILAVIFGGKATLVGPIIGGALFAILPEALLGLGDYNFAIFAAILLVTVIVLPSGLTSFWGLIRRPRTTRRVRPTVELPDAAELVRLPAVAVGSPVIVARDVGKRFGGLTAVRNVDLEVRRGEILGLIGPNGAGKTTLFTMLGGFQRPTEGRIDILGRPTARMKPHEVSNLGLVRTFQQAALFASLDVRANMMIASSRVSLGSLVPLVFRTSSYRAAEHGRAQLALQCLHEVGLQHRLDEKADSLPYGEQKLLGVAMALAARPSVILLDEPAAGLNMVEANRLREVLRTLRDKGLTIVIVDHNLTMLMSLVDRIVVLHHGVKIADGPPEQVATQDDVVTAYLGVKQAAAVVGGI